MVFDNQDNITLARISKRDGRVLRLHTLQVYAVDEQNPYSTDNFSYNPYEDAFYLTVSLFFPTASEPYIKTVSCPPSSLPLWCAYYSN